MKKNILLIAVLLVVSFSATVMVYGIDGYDSTVDPVVTLSYINYNVIPYINARVEELQNLITSGGTSGGSAAGISSADFNALVGRTSTLETNLNTLKGQYDTLAAKVSALEKNGVQAGYSGEYQYAANWTAIRLESGESIYAPVDAIELNLRSGKAVVVSPFADQGLSDMTAGYDLLNGTDITLNHYLIIPRGKDGRAIRITSEEAYVMVRGEYEIVK